MAKKISLVILDLDGTVADTIPDIARAIQKIILKYGDFGDLQELTRKSIGNGARKLLERVYDALGISKAELEQDLRDYEALYAKEYCIDTALYKNVLHTLNGLKQRGVKMAMATMKPRGATEGVLRKLGVLPYMELVLSADDMKAPKPDPCSVYECAKAAGVPVEECLMAGDGMTDVGAAKNAGIVSVAVMGGYYDQEKMLQSGADYIIYDIGEILNIVDEINEGAYVDRKAF